MVSSWRDGGTWSDDPIFRERSIEHVLGDFVDGFVATVVEN